jgi:hypothetical protein
MDDRRASSLAGDLIRAPVGESVSVLSIRLVHGRAIWISDVAYVSSTGAVVVLRRGFFAGTGASSSDLTRSETFSAILLVGDLELLARRL